MWDPGNPLKPHPGRSSRQSTVGLPQTRLSTGASSCYTSTRTSTSPCKMISNTGSIRKSSLTRGVQTQPFTSRQLLVRYRGTDVEPTQRRGESTQTLPTVPPTVNWHLTPFCNYKCRFCFATFDDTDKSKSMMEEAAMTQVLVQLKEVGFKRVTFVGGEPLLHPHIDVLVSTAKQLGLNTCLVTNGSLLTATRLSKLSGALDILAFSIDASDDAMHAEMGRGLSHEILVPEPNHAPGYTGTLDWVSRAASRTRANKHIARILALCPLARQLGITLKVNTVVNSVNVEDDMGPLIRIINPARWKIFQALPVEGQNSGRIEPLLVSGQDFNRYVERARSSLAGSGIPVVPEDNDSMRGSYAMLDPQARFFSSNTAVATSQSSTGCVPAYLYGPAIPEVGAAAAWQPVSELFQAEEFLRRGGVWEYGQGAAALELEQRQAQVAAGMLLAE